MTTTTTMLRLLSALGATVLLCACPVTDGTTGDGDGDTTGDNGDGDAPGDGDTGDGDTGDGDGDNGDGDGDTGDGDGDVVDPCADDACLPPAPTFKASTRNQLTWKRYRTLQQDLMAVLDLPPGEVCNELDRFSCVDDVHLVPLGANDPFYQALYQPLTEPSVTTPIAVDRTVLAACSNAVDRTRNGDSEVFAAFDLDAAAADGAPVTAHITAMFRGFHARDPQPNEIDEVKTLLVDDDGNAVSNADFLTLSCFAVGTMAEAIFY